MDFDLSTARRVTGTPHLIGGVLETGEPLVILDLETMPLETGDSQPTAHRIVLVGSQVGLLATLLAHAHVDLTRALDEMN
jgi:hypothetical protein